MIRILFAVAITYFCSAPTDCSAQLVGRRFRRPAPAAAHRPVIDAHRHQRQPSRPLPNYRNPLVSLLLDGPRPLTPRDPAEVNARYIGGFHYTYLDDVGIPNGDIGIRGNAYRWDTW